MRFEKSKADKEPRGMKEGSAKEEALDRRQMKSSKGSGKVMAPPKGGFLQPRKN